MFLLLPFILVYPQFFQIKLVTFKTNRKHYPDTLARQLWHRRWLNDPLKCNFVIHIHISDYKHVYHVLYLNSAVNITDETWKHGSKHESEIRCNNLRKNVRKNCQFETKRKKKILQNNFFRSFNEIFFVQTNNFGKDISIECRSVKILQKYFMSVVRSTEKTTTKVFERITFLISMNSFDHKL